MTLADHTNTDGIRRQRGGSVFADFTAEPDYGERDMALEGYYDTPRPANDNDKVYRSARSSRSNHCFNSTSFKYVDVALPPVSMIDGLGAAGAAPAGAAA